MKLNKEICMRCVENKEKSVFDKCWEDILNDREIILQGFTIEKDDEIFYYTVPCIHWYSSEESFKSNCLFCLEHILSEEKSDSLEVRERKIKVGEYYIIEDE